MTAKEWAHKLVTDFQNRKGTGYWPYLRRDQIATELHARIDNPDLIDQGSVNTCGVACMLRFWAQDNPSGYAWLGISLFENGIGYVGKNPTEGKIIRPSRELRGDRVPVDDYGRQMPHADWMMMSSIRQAYNLWMDYRSPMSGWINEKLEKVRAINTPGDIKAMLRSAGYRKIKDATSWFWGRGIDNALEAGTEAFLGRRVIMLIHSNMLDYDKQFKKGRDFVFATSNHWVGLMSDIVPSADKTLVLAFKVFSWGKEQRVPEPVHIIGMPVKAFVDNYYGYISAWY